MTLTYHKINTFVQDIANGFHNFTPSTGNQYAVVLTDVAPSATDSSFSGEISYANFSGVNPNYLTTSSSSQTSGTETVKFNNLTMAATGTIPQFRYIGIKNITTSKIVSWYDYGSELNITTGLNLFISFDGTTGFIQIT